MATADRWGLYQIRQRTVSLRSGNARLKTAMTRNSSHSRCSMRVPSDDSREKVLLHSTSFESVIIGALIPMRNVSQDKASNHFNLVRCFGDASYNEIAFHVRSDRGDGVGVWWTGCFSAMSAVTNSGMSFSGVHSKHASCTTKSDNAT